MHQRDSHDEHSSRLCRGQAKPKRIHRGEPVLTLARRSAFNKRSFKRNTREREEVKLGGAPRGAAPPWCTWWCCPAVWLQVLPVVPNRPFLATPSPAGEPAGSPAPAPAPASLLPGRLPTLPELRRRRAKRARKPENPRDARISARIPPFDAPFAPAGSPARVWLKSGLGSARRRAKVFLGKRGQGSPPAALKTILSAGSRFSSPKRSGDEFRPDWSPPADSAGRSSGRPERRPLARTETPLRESRNTGQGLRKCSTRGSWSHHYRRPTQGAGKTHSPRQVSRALTLDTQMKKILRECITSQHTSVCIRLIWKNTHHD